MGTSLLPLSSELNPKDLFLASNAGSYTYAHLQAFENYFINVIDLNRINVQNPLGLYARSSDELIFIIAACWKQGIPFVPFNPDAQPDTLKSQIQAIEPGLIIADGSDKGSPFDQEILDIGQFNLSKIFSANKQGEHSVSIQNEKQNQSDIFGYFFTSGTSSTPKIVPLKRRQMHEAARVSAKNIKLCKNECWLLCLPLHHIGGISVILRSLLYRSAIYRMDYFSREEAVKNLSKNKQIVAASLVPTMLSRLLDDPSFSTHASFKAMLLGGGPIAPELLEATINRNIPVITSYGMTETCALIAANSTFTQTKNEGDLNSVGHIFEPNEIEIRDEINDPAPAGTSGTIWLKGPQVFDGYYGSSKRSSFDKKGWFNTGDYGRLDNDRNIYIEARGTDLIITGGENVSPFEVEAALNKMGLIHETAVFGVPDEEWGQKVVAAVVFKQGENASLPGMQKFLESELEGFKLPKEIFVVTSLPKTETGKIKRGELQEHVISQR